MRWRLPVRRAHGIESEITGRGQRPDADYARYSDPYGEDVLYSGYSSHGQLLDPETNINIGTSYLQYVYQQFGNNRIFSSAAYNAGLDGCELAWQQRRAYRRCGICREYSVLRDARLCEERAGL